jgi:hypothetical protein
MCLVQLYFKYESARKHNIKFLHKFAEPVLSRQSIHRLVNKLKTRGTLLHKMPDMKQTVLTEETMDSSGARLEMSPRKSLKRLVFFRKSAKRAKKLLKL